MSVLPEPPGRYAWPPLPITDLEKASEIMAERLGEAFDDLEAQRLRLLGATMSSRRKADVARWITEFEAAIVRFAQRVEDDVAAFLRLHIGPRYEEAAMAVTGSPMSWTAPHLKALTSLTLDTYEDFLARSRAAQQVSEAFVAAVRDAAGRELPKIAAGGRTANQAGDRLEARLLKQYGIDTVTYRNGSQVSARTYARMAARTKSAVAYNAGTLTSCREIGVGYVEVYDGPDCGWTTHEDLDKADGTIRELGEAGMYALSHPNCLRGYGPRPDIRNAKEAKEGKSLQTDEQRADKIQVAKEKAATRSRTRASDLRRARKQATRAARHGAPQDVSDLVTQQLRARGLIA